jgi:hypothetical protein
MGVPLGWLAKGTSAHLFDIGLLHGTRGLHVLRGA